MNPSVMIVEDSTSTSRALKVMLQLHDYDVVGESPDGEKAVEMYRNLRPDLVLMDIAMPKKHGIEAIQDIKAMDGDAKIIVITALYSPEKKKKALLAGAEIVLMKPIDVPELIKAIKFLNQS